MMLWLAIFLHDISWFLGSLEGGEHSAVANECQALGHTATGSFALSIRVLGACEQELRIWKVVLDAIAPTLPFQ